MKGLGKVWCEFSDETSGANLAKWKKKELCTSYCDLEERVSFHVLWLTSFDVSYFAAHKLMFRQLHKPIQIPFIHIQILCRVPCRDYLPLLQALHLDPI